MILLPLLLLQAAARACGAPEAEREFEKHGQRIRGSCLKHYFVARYDVRELPAPRRPRSVFLL